MWFSFRVDTKLNWLYNLIMAKSLDHKVSWHQRNSDDIVAVVLVLVLVMIACEKTHISMSFVPCTKFNIAKHMYVCFIHFLISFFFAVAALIFVQSMCVVHICKWMYFTALHCTCSVEIEDRLLYHTIFDTECHLHFLDGIFVVQTILTSHNQL